MPLCALNVGYNKQTDLPLILKRYGRGAYEAASEFLFPTRCVGCGALGHIICDECVAKLHYIDQWRACQKCGAPYGRHQCCDCNSYSLAAMARKVLPYSRCVSALHFDELSAAIVRTRKDGGERRLAQAMGFMIACAVPPEWLQGAPVVCFVPATRSSFARRGFDHAHELASEVARILKLPCKSLLSARKVADQRGLGRASRVENVTGQFSTSVSVPARVLLVDDVYTTGATVMAASDTLCNAGASQVYVATFARVC